MRRMSSNNTERKDLEAWIVKILGWGDDRGRNDIVVEMKRIS